MLSFIYNHLVTRRQRPRLKRNYYRTQKFISETFFPYDEQDVQNALAGLGVRPGDTLLVHSSFNALKGFQGKPQDIIACLLQAVGEQGNILMPSMSYRTSSYDYLMKNEVFHVTRTPSRMGLLTELFRRKEGVLRSGHPVHPVLAYGRDARWIVDGHEHCLYSCGKGSPFDKFRSLGGKVLFFDVPFNTFTFIHYIEDHFKDRLPFELYHREPLRARVVDSLGREGVVPAFVFSERAVRTRKPELLEDMLRRRNLLRRLRIGRVELMAVTAEDAVGCAGEMLRRNRTFFTGAGDGH